MFLGPDGDVEGVLEKVTRQSPTLGAAPPAGAVVLFDGSSADAFEGGKLLEGGLLAVGCDSKQGFGDHRLHLEFRTPFQPAARGQGRGNSGVYVQGRYECQVLDSFGLAGKQNECGGVYSISDPIVNACLPPGQWQTYDIQFTAAKWRGLEKVADARMTVHLNGILVHDDLALTRRLREAGFDGVGLHLGEQDASLDEARRRLGSEPIIGASCYASLAIAERAAAAGASYLAFGRFFVSQTKPEASPAPLELLGEAARFGLPRVAIGGLDVDNVARVRHAGGDLLATVYAVFGGDDPTGRVAGLRQHAGYA